MRRSATCLPSGRRPLATDFVIERASAWSFVFTRHYIGGIAVFFHRFELYFARGDG